MGALTSCNRNTQAQRHTNKQITKHITNQTNKQTINESKKQVNKQTHKQANTHPNTQRHKIAFLTPPSSPSVVEAVLRGRFRAASGAARNHIGKTRPTSHFFYQSMNVCFSFVRKMPISATLHHRRSVQWLPHVWREPAPPRKYRDAAKETCGRVGGNSFSIPKYGLVDT